MWIIGAFVAACAGPVLREVVEMSGLLPCRVGCVEAGLDAAVNLTFSLHLTALAPEVLVARSGKVEDPPFWSRSASLADISFSELVEIPLPADFRRNRTLASVAVQLSQGSWSVVAHPNKMFGM